MCEWRKISGRLRISSVAKGKKECVGSANFMIAISHGKGVVMCEKVNFLQDFRSAKRQRFL